MLLGNKCKYCDSIMQGQDNDNMGNGLYSKIYVCTSTACRAVYELWTDSKGRSRSEKNRWWNPNTNQFED